MTCNLSSKDEFYVNNYFQKVNSTNLVSGLILAFKELFHLLATDNGKHHSQGFSPSSIHQSLNGFLRNLSAEMRPVVLFLMHLPYLLQYPRGK